MAINKSVLDTNATALDADVINYIYQTSNNVVSFTGDASPLEDNATQFIDALIRMGRKRSIKTNFATSSGSNINLDTERTTFSAGEVIAVLVPNTASTTATTVTLNGTAYPLEFPDTSNVPFSVITNKAVYVKFETTKMVLLDASSEVSISPSITDNTPYFPSGLLVENANTTLLMELDQSFTIPATSYIRVLHNATITDGTAITFSMKMDIDSITTYSKVIVKKDAGQPIRAFIVMNNGGATPLIEYACGSTSIIFKVGSSTVSNVHLYNAVTINAGSMTTLVCASSSAGTYTSFVASNPTALGIVHLDVASSYELLKSTLPNFVSGKKDYLDLTQQLNGTSLSTVFSEQRYVRVVLGGVAYVGFAFHGTTGDMALLYNATGVPHLYVYASNIAVPLNYDITPSTAKLLNGVPANHNTMKKIEDVLSALDVPSLPVVANVFLDGNTDSSVISVPNVNIGTGTANLALNKGTVDAYYEAFNPSTAYLDAVANNSLDIYKGVSSDVYDGHVIGSTPSAVGAVFTSTNTGDRDLSVTDSALYYKKNDNETVYVSNLAVNPTDGNGHPDLYSSYVSDSYVNEKIPITDTKLHETNTNTNGEGAVTFPKSVNVAKVLECVKAGYIEKEYNRGDLVDHIISETCDIDWKQIVPVRDGLMMLTHGGDVHVIHRKHGGVNYTGSTGLISSVEQFTTFSVANTAPINPVGVLFEKLYSCNDRVYASTHDGKVYGMGENTAGALGAGSAGHKTTFNLVFTGSAGNVFSFSSALLYETRMAVTTFSTTTLYASGDLTFYPAIGGVVDVFTVLIASQPGKGGVYKYSTVDVNFFMENGVTRRSDSSGSTIPSLQNTEGCLYVNYLYSNTSYVKLLNDRITPILGHNYLYGRGIHPVVPVHHPAMKGVNLGHGAELPPIDKFIVPGGGRGMPFTTVVKCREGEYYMLSVDRKDMGQRSYFNWIKIVLPNGANIIYLDIEATKTSSPSVFHTLITILDDRNKLWVMGDTTKYGFFAGDIPMRIRDDLITGTRQSTFSTVG